MRAENIGNNNTIGNGVKWATGAAIILIDFAVLKHLNC